MWRRTIAASVIALALVGVGACGQPDGLDTVVGVLPDGTRYELRHPPGLTIGEVEGVDAVPVWVNWPPGLSYVVGVTNFYRTDTDGLGPPTPEATAGQATVVDGQLTVRAGIWVMEITLYDHSVGREPDLEMIQARAQDGLIVIDLPPSLRFQEDDELPRQIEVKYATVSVVRGCEVDAVCSPDGQIMVRPTEARVDLTGLEVRVLSP
jgi:hypothetical protein